MMVNLETAVAPADVGLPFVEKEYLFRSDPIMVEQMARAGIDAVSLANNHALDFGSDALSNGLGLLEASGIAAVGGGVDAEAAYKPLIQTVGEWTVGIAAFSRVPCDWASSGKNVRPGVAWACPAFMADADGVVNALVDDVDLAVVMVHGGTEGQLCPDQTMRNLNQHWANIGVGLVVNSHPHVVQGVSSIGETMIINSLGNFAFPPSFGLTANSAVFLATLTEQGLLLSVEPFVSEGGVPRAGTPLRRRSILNQIDTYSEGWRVLSDGRLIQDSSWSGACIP
jgi:poly-gamma-glutamate synthesis protein (capsule biosynthesis protein)